MTCRRCQGLMVEEGVPWLYRSSLTQFRCLNCGHLVDGAVLARYRPQPIDPDTSRGKRKGRAHGTVNRPARRVRRGETGLSLEEHSVALSPRGLEGL